MTNTQNVTATFALQEIVEPSEQPTPNIPLLRKAVEWAEAESLRAEDGEWDQREWRMVTDCGTTYCIAGYVCFINGAEWERPRGAMTIHADADDDPEYTWTTEEGRWTTVEARARRLLGISMEESGRLFYPCEDIGGVRYVAEQIATRAGERL